MFGCTLVLQTDLVSPLRWLLSCLPGSGIAEEGAGAGEATDGEAATKSAGRSRRHATGLLASLSPRGGPLSSTAPPPPRPRAHPDCTWTCAVCSLLTQASSSRTVGLTPFPNSASPSVSFAHLSRHPRVGPLSRTCVPPSTAIM